MEHEDLDAAAALYAPVAAALARGRVVTFLGAGANLCDRGTGVRFKPGEDLPSGGELAEYLARIIVQKGYPVTSCERSDLVRMSQYMSVIVGDGPLYAELRDLLDFDYPCTTVHKFLARLPAILRKRGLPQAPQFIITTNYDDLMERAYEQEEVEFDLMTYIAVGQDRGTFVHRLPDGAENHIHRPNEYMELPIDNKGTIMRNVIMKIHGAIDRQDDKNDSFVITEDDYIDYLKRTELSDLIPATLNAKLQRSHFLFLGYSLRDWNLRVMLKRIWEERRLSWESWAVQLSPSQLETKYWTARGVSIIDMNLREYVAGLSRHIDKLQPSTIVS